MGEKILVIQTAFIGDVVLATGIVEKLHTYFPDAEIDFLLRKGNESLLQGHPFLHEVIVWNKKENKLGNLRKLLKKIRSRKYDKIINVQRFAATGILTAFSGAKETIGYDKNPLSMLFTTRVKHIIATKENPKHEIERCNDLIKHFTDDKIFKPKLYPSQADEQAIAVYSTQPYIVIAPASVWYTKQYSASKWIDFIKRLPANLQVYLIGGPPDKKLCDDILIACEGLPVHNICGKLSFLESAALMKGAKMNYVNDSAPMHFASSVNAPVSAIYCSTLPSFGFGPLSDVRFIIENQEPLPCRPCGLHGHKACPQQHFKCAMDIKDEQLIATLETVLK